MKNRAWRLSLRILFLSGGMTQAFLAESRTPSCSSTSIREIGCQFSFAVVAGDATHAYLLTEVELCHASEFRRPAEAEQSMGIEGAGGLQHRVMVPLRSRHGQRCHQVVRDIEGHNHIGGYGLSWPGLMLRAVVLGPSTDQRDEAIAIKQPAHGSPSASSI